MTVYSSEVTASQYIRARMAVDETRDASANKSTVRATLQYRRTNSYGSPTYQYGSGCYFVVTNGTYSYTYNQTSGNYFVIPAYNTNWLNVAYQDVTYTHTSAQTITCSWYTNGMGTYLSSSGSVNVTLAAFAPSYTAPSKASCSITKYTTYARVQYGTSSFGKNASGGTTGTSYLYGTGSSSTNQLQYTNTVGTTAGSYYFYPSAVGTYYFRARAANSSVWGDYSDQQSVTFSASGPSTPTVSGVAASTSQINVTWGTSSFGFPNAGTVYLYGGTGPSPTTLLASKSSTGTGTFSHTGLSAGTVYYYRAYAKNTSDMSSSYTSDVSVRTRYLPPTSITAKLNESPEMGKASSTITVGDWGQGSTSSTPYYILNSTKGSLASSTSSTITWTVPTASTSTTSGAINTWYARATNSHSEIGDSGAYYLVTPSAPSGSAIGHTGTAPYLTRSCSVTYTGGTTNSSIANTSTIKQWAFTKTQLSNNTSVTTTRSTSEKSQSIDYSMDDFVTGSNYTFTTKVSNTLGGVGQTTTQTYYAPGGVGGSLATLHPDQVELRASTTSPGGMGSTTEGNIACYQIKWGETSTSLTNTTRIQADTLFELNDLTPGATYYYQVIAWNTYGLSNISPVMNFTTGGRYVPTITKIDHKDLSPGVDLSVTIGRSGGVTEDELTINRLVLQTRPTSGTVWSIKKDVTGLELHAGETYVIEKAWTNYFADAGNHDLKITAYNEFDSGSRTFPLDAPTNPNVTTPGLTDTPTQIKLNATITAGWSDVNSFEMSLTGGEVNIEKNEPVTIPAGATYTSTIISPNYLSFATTYTAYVTAKDKSGLWSTTPNGVKITTPARLTWHFVNANGMAKEGTPLYRSGVMQRTIDNAYYIVANALGTQAVEGFNLRNKRLTFIKQPLFYRPESVALAYLSDGTQLGYNMDGDADMYKFGIWKNGKIQTTFFDGEKWLMDHYDFKDTNLTISSLVYRGKGLNASSAFSTTVCEEIVPWR